MAWDGRFKISIHLTDEGIPVRLCLAQAGEVVRSLVLVGSLGGSLLAAAVQVLSMCCVWFVGLVLTHSRSVSLINVVIRS